MKSRRSKACDITQKVKKTVWERDGEKCILCKNLRGYPAMPNAHYIPRSNGGLGIKENVVTLCQKCHDDYDKTSNRQLLMIDIGMYLDSLYPNFNHDNRFYKKGGGK